MISYVDSEVKIFHPLCEDALNQALKNLSLNSEYEVLHHQYTGTLEMDYVVRNRRTKKYLCVIEVKRTPADVQSTRYQVQAQSYVQMNSPENEKPFYILTNLEKLISFRYDTTKPRVYQQMLLPGLENVCDFSMDDEHKIVNKLAKIFTRLIDEFRNDRYQYLTTLEQFLGYMNSTIADDKKWKSSMAMLMYEYIRGAFRAVRRTEIRYDVHKFHNDIEQICIEANSVDFDGIFAYDSAKYLPRLTMSASILADIYKYGNVNISGDAIADALHNMVSEDKHHEGEVATDLELASLAAVLAKMSNGALANGKKICDPAAGSGNLICSSINIFNAEPNQLIANDINPKLIELLSLRLQSVTSGYCRKDFATVFPGVEARVFDWSELDTAVEDGWRMVCSEMSEAIDFANKSFWMNDKLIPLSDSTSNKKCGSTDRGGGTDLLYFETFETLANKYKSVPLDEGVRVAKSDDFELYKGTNKFINFNNLSNSLSISIINDFIPLQRKSGKQQRTVKSVAEWNKIFRTKGRAQFPENSVLVPTKIRKSGRIHLARIPLHVSSNFTVFSYENAETAEIIASYMTTVFYQLDCEIQAKVHAGVRKQDMRDIIKTYVPKVDLITKEARNIIKNEIPNIVFLNLSQPQIRKIDKIWAEILFGSNSEKYVTEAQRLLRFLANRRNPQ